jgi:B9 domain-containing protein 1
VVYCTGRDFSGKEIVKAYGSVHVPIQPGVHDKTMRMFAPLENNRFYEFFGIFKEGSGVHIDQPELIANAVGRDVSRVKAGGKLKISM